MNSICIVPAAAVVPLNGNWNLKGWPTPARGGVRTLEEVPAKFVGEKKIDFAPCPPCRRWMGL